MCVAFYLYDCLEKYIFVLAFNRDEIFQRYIDKESLIRTEV